MTGVMFLDSVLKQLLQDHIEIKTVPKGKTIRKGSLMLYSIKEFYMTLIIKTVKDETKQYHMPYPYRIEVTDDYVDFDYRLEHIYRSSSIVEDIVHELGESKSVYYDNILRLIRNG
jgi:hypothetical protein